MQQSRHAGALLDVLESGTDGVGGVHDQGSVKDDVRDCGGLRGWVKKRRGYVGPSRASAKESLAFRPVAGPSTR